MSINNFWEIHYWVSVSDMWCYSGRDGVWQGNHWVGQAADSNQNNPTEWLMRNGLCQGEKSVCRSSCSEHSVTMSRWESAKSTFEFKIKERCIMKENVSHPVQSSQHPRCPKPSRLSSLVFLFLIGISHFLWRPVNRSPNHSNLQAPLCLPVTQNNSQNRHNYSLISWPVMWRAWWNILYPLIFPQGAQETWSAD